MPNDDDAGLDSGRRGLILVGENVDSTASKAFVVAFPVIAVKKFVIGFVRGFFGGDGCGVSWSPSSTTNAC